MPKVSVIIPTYNSAKYVGAAVESVLAQTFTDYEIIVVDDGSTDETKQVLQRYEDKITYIYQENQERSAARNTGIRAARGEYLAFLDADDVWYPIKLDRQVSVLEQHSEVALCCCWATYMDSNGKPTRLCGRSVDGDEGNRILIADRTQDLPFGNVVPNGGSTSVVPRSRLSKVGLFDEALTFGEDWHLWARLAREGPFAYILEPLAWYRIYGWEKILIQEASEQSVAQQLKVIEAALIPWHADPAAQNRLRTEAVATLEIRAALASIQLGEVSQGQRQLARAMTADPGLNTNERLKQLAVDRARLIELETGSYQDAEVFIHRFFSSLPVAAAQFSRVRKEAVGWLYINGAFEQHRLGHRGAARRLLAQGLVHAPMCFKNGGVVSVALEAWFGKAVADALRGFARKIMAITA